TVILQSWSGKKLPKSFPNWTPHRCRCTSPSKIKPAQLCGLPQRKRPFRTKNPLPRLPLPF
ncbi:uncharacterized protein METZ01_LOCUS198346, partial [marine metagenome]